MASSFNMNNSLGLLWIESLAFIFIAGCTINPCNHYAADCQDYLDICHTTSGVYHVTPVGMYTGYDVYCDMTTEGGGWVVFQRRLDGSLDFNKVWSEYQRGFGENKSQEYWLGLLPLKRILSQGHYELRIDLEDFTGETRYAKYDSFDIGDFTDKYRLKVTGYTGTAGDSFSYHNGHMFSTTDSDNDAFNHSCSEKYKAGWWYNACHQSNLNGFYLNGSHTSYANGINWEAWKGSRYSMKAADMKIRRA